MKKTPAIDELMAEAARWEKLDPDDPPTVRGPETHTPRCQKETSDMAWATYEGDIWVCDWCGFSFPKEHKDEGGGYSCPVCAEARLRAGLKEIVGLASAHFGACLFCSEAHGPQKPDMGTCPIGRALYALVPTESESEGKDG